MLLNTCNFIKRIEQVLVELDISAIEDYIIIIMKMNSKIHNKLLHLLYYKNMFNELQKNIIYFM